MTARHAVAAAHAAHSHAHRQNQAGARRQAPHLQRRMARSFQFGLERVLVLPTGAAIALLWANTAPESYFSFSQSLTFAVNEIGMAFFFALMAQEVLEAVMPGGALHSWRRWTVPIVAAAGGAAGAVGAYLLYVRLAYEETLMPAWPIACAIDAAAAYYLLKTIMPRTGALPFALLVAVVTDFFASIIVAPTSFRIETRAGGAALMTTALLLAVLMRSMKIRVFWPYLFVCGTIAWVAFYWEGLHPAFALVPLVPFLPHEPRRLDVFADPRSDDAVHRAEREWSVLTKIVLFLFGLVNAGVVLNGYDTGTWAMITARLAGRPIGMLAAIGVAFLAGLHLPRHIGWREILVIALATSSGFSIALFFATGLFGPGPLLAQVKLGVLGSAAGAFLAFGAARLLKVGKYAS
jgi:Na+:H+ antiporter, NhaA family